MESLGALITKMFTSQGQPTSSHTLWTWPQTQIFFKDFKDFIATKQPTGIIIDNTYEREAESPNDDIRKLILKNATSALWNCKINHLHVLEIPNYDRANIHIQHLIEKTSPAHLIIETSINLNKISLPPLAHLEIILGEDLNIDTIFANMPDFKMLELTIRAPSYRWEQMRHSHTLRSIMNSGEIIALQTNAPDDFDTELQSKVKSHFLEIIDYEATNPVHREKIRKHNQYAMLGRMKWMIRNGIIPSLPKEVTEAIVKQN